MPWKWLFFLVVIGGLSAGAYAWYSSAQPPPIQPERLVEPHVGDIARGVIAVGRVEPRTRVEVKSKANGIIRKFHVDVNDPVRAGQVIVELDQEILQARVAEAEGKLKQAMAALEQARAEIQRIETEKNDPELAFAEKYWQRAQNLYAEGVASEDQRDLVKERFEKAKYKIQILDAGLKLAEANLDAAGGRVKEVQAQADLARQELLEATIASPIDGVVLYRHLEEGDSVSSIRVAGGNATIIMTLGDLSELYVDGEVDEVNVGEIIDEQKIRPNLIARVSVESFKKRTFLGRVARITPLGLQDSNGIVTFEVRIVLENPEKLLLANMTANALIVLQERKNVLLLSQGAVIADGKNRYATVYDPQSGRAQRKKITVGITDGSQVEITEGLEPGAKVVIP
ncbi:MAG: efflux RND transporter periplasmic adaptor subunit [Planctomycetes bacterium]|nr:efflux RND transporter periplasmic adaptor subunit [Planctomycetota bacterium]